jgi:hypothetical protein
MQDALCNELYIFLKCYRSQVSTARFIILRRWVCIVLFLDIVNFYLFIYLQNNMFETGNKLVFIYLHHFFLHTKKKGNEAIYDNN